jgi:hypothetical protein
MIQGPYCESMEFLEETPHFPTQTSLIAAIKGKVYEHMGRRKKTVDFSKSLTLLAN